MKIINTTYRDVTDEEFERKTPVSGLHLTSELYDDSLLHIIQHTSGTGDNAKYDSMKMNAGDFKQKIYEAVQNTFKTAYRYTHCYGESDAHNKYEDAPEGTSFKELVDYLKERDAKTPNESPKWTPAELSDKDQDGFVKHLFYDFDVLKRFTVLKFNSLNFHIDDFSDWVVRLDCMFSSLMTFHTTKQIENDEIAYSALSVNHNQNVDDQYAQMHIDTGNKISNEWTCPATGNLVVYGWLDSTSVLNNKAIPSAYCVIEANINSEWEIIGAQPVMPAKNITYVGFNIPVHKNLVIRARTGFTVGAKSGQYSNVQDGNDTLSNSVANGFKCMVYANKNYKRNEDVEEDEESGS